MNRWIRRGLWSAVALAVLAGTAVATGTTLAERKMNRQIDVPSVALAIRGDAAAVERGRYLYASRGCADCHGGNGAGKVVLDDGKGLKIVAPNITAGGAVAAYGERDWDRTLRHGVKPSGRPLMVMPSEDYARLTNDDTAAIVAYVKQLAPVAGGPALISLPTPVRALYGFGLIEDAAAKIDHTLPPATPVAEGVTVEHGAYVATMCVGCHGAQLAGGKIPGAPPDWPAAADLRPGTQSALARYPDADTMIRMFRSGRRPDGTRIEVMPFEALRVMSETDARALHLYLTGRRS
jgi:mono/diheme cytochrome c family protein